MAKFQSLLEVPIGECEGRLALLSLILFRLRTLLVRWRDSGEFSGLPVLENHLSVNPKPAQGTEFETSYFGCQVIKNSKKENIPQSLKFSEKNIITSSI